MSWSSQFVYEKRQRTHGRQMCVAIEKGDLEGIESCLLNGCNLNENWIIPPLSRAVDTENIETIDFLIEKGASVNYGDSQFGRPLHRAIYKQCSFNVLKNLITKGADVNLVAGDNTPLTVAIQYNNFEAAQLLLSHGADLNKPNKNDSTPLTIAEQLERTEFLKTPTVDERRMYEAIKSRRLDSLEYLIEDGANVCEIYSNKKTPLLTAVECNNLAAVKLLVERGADVTMQTAFLEAINQNDIGIVQYFLDKGVLINFVYRSGITPLTKSIKKGNFNIMKTLVEKGADVNFLGRQKDYPLSLALETNDLQIVKYLVNKGAKIDGKHWNLGKLETSKQAGIKLKSVLSDELDSSLLVEAVQAENIRVVKYLIEQGASVTSKILLAEAAKSQNIAIIKLLMEHGADINLAIEEMELFAKKNEDFEVYLQKLRKPKPYLSHGLPDFEEPTE